MAIMVVMNRITRQRGKRQSDMGLRAEPALETPHGNHLRPKWPSVPPDQLGRLRPRENNLDTQDRV